MKENKSFWKRISCVHAGLLILISGSAGPAQAKVPGPLYGAEASGSLDYYSGGGVAYTFSSGGPGSTTASTNNGLSDSTEISNAALATGVLQAYAVSTGILGVVLQPYAAANALLWDTLTFVNQSGTDVTLTGGQITLTLPSTNYLTGYGSFGGACLALDTSLGTPLCSAADTTHFTSSSTFPYSLSISLAGLSTDTRYEFSAGLDGAVSEDSSGTANLGDPPNISISDLPNGISILSADPTAFGLGGTPPSATPEPPAFWLMAAGLLGMFGWSGYRRIRASV